MRLDYRLDATGVATLRHAAVSCARLARASGAIDVVIPGTRPAWSRGRRRTTRPSSASSATSRPSTSGPTAATVFSAHQMGTARMGASAARTRLRPGPGGSASGPRDDRVVGGLYVADTSLFPTGLGVNPMLTVMALARRVARTVLAEG